MQHRLGDERDHPLRRGEQVVQVDLERRRREVGGGLLETATETVGPLFGRAVQPIHELADLLVLEQPSHQLGARVFPLIVAETARQQQLRLDAQQPRRHLQIVRRLVQPQVGDHREELVRDA